VKIIKQVPTYTGDLKYRQINGKRPMVRRDVESYFRSVLNTFPAGYGCQRCSILIGKSQINKSVHIWRGWELCSACYLHKMTNGVESTPDLEDVERFNAFIGL